MSGSLIDLAEAPYRNKEAPEFRIGDTVTVHVRIVEGGKERIQPFTGVVMARRGSGLRETFTVRRIVANEGVERVFPVHSPNIVRMEVKRSGKARRAKLYFLRDRVGKARRLRERRAASGSSAAAEAEHADADSEQPDAAEEPSGRNPDS